MKRYTELELSSEELDLPTTIRFNAGVPRPEVYSICSTQRTGSFLLCRILTNLGAGVPHEYYHTMHQRIIGPRINLQPETIPKTPTEYLYRLMGIRTRKNLFGFKVQPWEMRLNGLMRCNWFHETRQIHLYRRDVEAQARSFQKAWKTGKWGFDDTVTTPQRNYKYLLCLDLMQKENSAWENYFEGKEASHLGLAFEDLLEKPLEKMHQVCSFIGHTFDEEKCAEYLKLEGLGTDKKRFVRHI